MGRDRAEKKTPVGSPPRGRVRPRDVGQVPGAEAPPRGGREEARDDAIGEVVEQRRVLLRPTTAAPCPPRVRRQDGGDLARSESVFARDDDNAL